jgi:glycosyltransferase involved in cell wall biosynthesis
LRRELDCENSFLILYVGAISEANHIEMLADTIDLLQSHSGWKWWFVGDGNKLEWLGSEKLRREWHSVMLLGRQPKMDVPDFAAAADCGVISFVPTPVYYENSPNKFLDYIASGHPVVFSRSTWIVADIAEYDCVLIAEDRDPRSLAKAILKLKRDPSRAREMGLNARRLAEDRFSRDVIASRYLRLLEEVARPATERVGVVV